MSKLAWDQVGEREYTTGIDRGVLFPYDTAKKAYGKGVAWNGLRSFSESPSGAESNPFYADNIKYLNLLSAEDYGGTIGAYTFPDEFKPMNGMANIAPGVTIGQQTRKIFGFSYRVIKGNDTELNDHGYIINLIYNAQASPSEEEHSTVNDSPEPDELSWEISTTPISVAGHKPTSIVKIDSTKTDPAKLAAFEAILYGTDGEDTYTAVTPETGDDPTVKGWYEKNGDDYVLSTDASVDSSKTYYEKSSTGTDPRLPLPDEVATLLGDSNG